MDGKPNKRVLVVDGHIDFGEGLVAQLGDFGFDARYAMDAETAKSVCREFEPDVALVDIRLGQESGLELVSELRSMEPAPICVMVTGNSDIGSAIEALRHGAYDYLMKPVDERTLLSSLDRCFAYRGLEQEKLAAEARIRSSEEQVRLLMNSTAESIYGIDLEGDCTFANPACIATLGYDGVEELLGKHMHDLIHHTRSDGTRYPAGECLIYQAFIKGKGTHVEDEVLWRRDGTSFPVEYWSYPVRQEDEVVGAVVTFLDITERRLVEEALQKSEEQYRILANLSPVGIFHTDAARKCLFVNERWQQIAGCSAEEAMGDGWVSSLYPDDRQMVSDEWWKARDEDRPFHAEYRFGDSEENVTWVLGQASAIRDGTGSITGYVGTVTDISLAKSMEKTLTEIHQIQTMGEIAGNVAHHLNNMLAVVSGNIEIALFSMSDEGKVRTCLDKSLEASHRIGNLTQQLLSYSRRQFLMVKPVDLNQPLRQLEGPLRTRIPDDVRLVFELADGLWRVRTDSDQFTRAIDAIVTNAIEAIDGSGKILITSENMIVDPDRPKLDCGDYVVITVTDSGHGMDTETALRSTEPFYTTKEIGTGTGLGLSMAYGFARQSCGGLLIESEPERGSTIQVFLPRIEENG